MNQTLIGGIYITILEKHFSAKVYRRCTKCSKLPCLPLHFCVANTAVDSVVNAHFNLS